MGDHHQLFMGSYYSYGYGDGDLEAIVKGSNSNYTPFSGTTTMDNNNNIHHQNTYSMHNQYENDFVFNSYDDLGFFDELEALYKPFYPNMNSYSPCRTMMSASSASQEIEVREKKPSVDDVASGSSPNIVCAPHETKYKRRKNQQKRVVMQVKEKDLSSDKWAWRKYGQKPIKGSPYPRSYYRCSSSKGCLARKQVERSLSDPQTFIITYAAEHCHGHPTRRNSLAGTTRNKLFSGSNPKSPNTNVSERITTSSPPNKDSPNYSSPNDLIVCQQEATMIKSEREELGEENWQQIGDHMVLKDDFVLGFDEMDCYRSGDMGESMKWFGIQ